jgi:hypothetical protein
MMLRRTYYAVHPPWPAGVMVMREPATRSATPRSLVSSWIVTPLWFFKTVAPLVQSESS